MRRARERSSGPCPQSPSTNLVTQKELEEAGGPRELLRPLREVGGVEADWIDSDVDARVGAARLWRHLEDALHRELGGREGLSIAQLSLVRRGG